MKKQSIFNEFYVDGGQAELSHVLLHLTEPVSAKEIMKGYFFALFECSKITAKQIDNLEKIVLACERDYYENQSASTLHSFSNALTHSKALFDSIQHDGKINAALGTIDSEHIRISTAGSPVIWIIFPHKGKLLIHDLTPKNMEAVESFENVIEGQLKLSQKIFVAAPTLLKFLDRDRFLKIIRDKTAPLASKSVEKIFSSLENQFSYAGFFIDGLELKQQKAMPKFLPHAMTQANGVAVEIETIENLHKKEEETANMLSPGFKLGAGLFKKFLGYAADFLQSNELNREHFKKIYDATYGWLPNSKRMVPFVKNWFKTLSPVSKSAMAGGIIALTIFIFSISYLSLTQNSRERKARFEEILASVYNKKNLIESSLIYNDEKAAKKHLDEARQILASMVTESRKEKKAVNLISAELNETALKLQKIAKADAIEIIRFEEFGVRAHSFLIRDNTIFATDEDKLFQINLISRETKKHEFTNGSKIIALEEDEEKNIFILTENGQTVKLKIDSSRETYSANITPLELNSAKSFKFYADRIYALIPDKNKILIYRKRDSGFGLAELWNREEIKIENAVDFAVESNVYILNNDAQVQKFRLGKKQAFNIAPLDPPSTNANLIKTKEGADLFILENGDLKRIAQYSKQGELMRQFASDKLSDIADFEVDGKKIYVLDSNVLYELDIQ